MTPAERNDLFRRWRGGFWMLARRWYAYCHPLDRRSAGVDDLAQDFARIAAQRFLSWEPRRGTFWTWLHWIARSRATYLNAKASRPKRAGIVQSAGRLLNLLVDPKAIDPAKGGE